MRILVPPALLLLALAGCAGGSPPACPAGAQRMQVSELLFGRNIGDRLGVSEADWQGFLDQEVTPRFPDGFTVIDMNGQWRGQDRKIVHEAGKLLLIAFPDDADRRARLVQITEAYKARFRQESVPMIERPGCVTF